MLHTLELRDFAIVDELALELGPGLNVLTGETGAGKSIVVDALELLGGGRADTSMIRSGADSALVQATFTGTPFESASRRLGATGRHAARLDGELVTVAELGEAVGANLRVFGQHSAQVLLSAASQREQLDRLLPPDSAALLARHRAAFAELQDVSARLSSLRESARERSRRLDALLFEMREIDAAKPAPGEDDALEAELATLQHAERIVLAGGRALEALGGEEGSALTRAADALRELDGVARHSAPLADLARDLRELVSGLGAVSAEVEAFLSDFQADPERLDSVQARLATLEGLKRKYGADLPAVVQYRSAAAAEARGLEGADDEIARLEGEAERLEEELTALGERLTAARRGAAAGLASAVLPLLHQLGLPHARFQAVVAPAAKRTRSGVDEVTFEFGANPGEAARKVSEAASGGELSRIMLALHLVTGSDLPTVAFDEVDAGVGGETAIHVGTLLKRLAGSRQVVVVTHLAQVAAFADAHFKVEKVEANGRTVARVRRLNDDERAAELARLLSGTLTETSLRHARELLANAAEAPALSGAGRGQARAKNT